MFSAATRKRQPRSTKFSGFSVEALETRQLLSATNCIAEPESAAVGLGVPPDTEFDPVGAWNYTVNGVESGVAIVSPKGKGFLVELEFAGVDAKLKGKRDKDDANLIFFKGKAKIPVYGKLKVGMETELLSDTAFIADLTATAKKQLPIQLDVAGSKVIVTSAVPMGVSEPFDPVGSWEIFVAENPLQLTSGAVDITAKGKKGFVAEGDLNGIDLTLKGKRDKNDPNLIVMKGAVKLPEIGKIKIMTETQLLSNSTLEGAFIGKNKQYGTFETTVEGIKLGG